MISSCVAPALPWWLPRSYDIFLSKLIIVQMHLDSIGCVQGVRKEEYIGCLVWFKAVVSSRGFVHISHGITRSAPEAACSHWHCNFFVTPTASISFVQAGTSLVSWFGLVE